MLFLQQTSLYCHFFLNLNNTVGIKINIKNIETFRFQSNRFHFMIFVSKYFFRNIIIMMNLQDVKVPQTIKGFLNLIVVVKVILS
jgi:hypothetical protein